MDAAAATSDLVRRSARLSADGRYRFRLDRWWAPGRRVVFTMLNPSVADAARDDATARRVSRFARAWGFPGVTVVNLHPLRATSVRDLHAWLLAGGDGEAAAANRDASREAWAGAACIVVAWGRHGGAEGALTLAQLRADGHEVHALAVNRDGSPRHPLYVPADARPRPLDAPRAGWGKVEHQP
ncbi:MAG: DUF1643 domain-containing protein [Dehalococcoidia bacterium]